MSNATTTIECPFCGFANDPQGKLCPHYLGCFSDDDTRHRSTFELLGVPTTTIAHLDDLSSCSYDAECCESFDLPTWLAGQIKWVPVHGIGTWVQFESGPCYQPGEGEDFAYFIREPPEPLRERNRMVSNLEVEVELTV